MLATSRKRPHSAVVSPDKQNYSDFQPEESENINPSSLFFPQGERRRDLNIPQEADDRTKRVYVDAPVFSQSGLDESLIASEPLAKQSLMGIATGELIYYGDYFERNKLLRELTFERESRQLRFGSPYRIDLRSRNHNNEGINDDDDL